LEFFARIGAPIYLGYGLTETSPVVSVNTPKANRAGSVGRPLAGVRVRIQNDENHPDGEILTAGPHVMKGYYRQPDLTASVIDPHGWFHTGDLGRIDEDGFLYITGRIKNVIILSSGKKVNPDEVEAVISKSELIKEVCVVGAISSDGLTAGTEEVCAIIVPIEEVVRESEDIDEAIGAEVRRLYNELAPYKRPSRICVRLEDLPKTTTRKVKRAVLLEWLAKQDLVPAQSNLPG
jgi:long-chain acyl-CoA synthetase